MQVLIDAPLLLNAILNRYGGETSFSEFWEELQRENIQGYLTETGLGYIYQHIYSWQDDSSANQITDWIRSLVTICPVNSEVSQQAHGLPVGDYESAIAIVLAIKLGLSAVATDKPQNFVEANLQVLSVTDLIKRLRLERSTMRSSPVNISQWFHGNFPNSWIPLNIFSQQRQSNFAFRWSRLPLGAGKILKLDTDVEVALVVKPTLTNEGMDIWAELWPVGRQSYLSNNLKVEVIDGAGKIAMSDQTNGKQEKIHLNFDARRDEVFSLKVSFGAISITEVFKS